MKFPIQILKSRLKIFYFTDMEVNVTDICRSSIKPGRIKKVVRKILKDQKRNAERINIIICDNKKILELNRRFRQINKPTDVLSFPFNDSDLLGEIYICKDCAQKQAEQNDHTVDDEVQRLVVHGAVHLLGYTHKSKKDTTQMQKIESRYL